MDLQWAVGQVFATDGRLAQAVSTFKPRAGQTQMAREVASTLQHGGMLVVEAGTGIGKTFAYLIPALLSGQRVLLSTATKALQDQLFFVARRITESMQQHEAVELRFGEIEGAGLFDGVLRGDDEEGRGQF